MAIPIGLIINETVSNSLKYAFIPNNQTEMNLEIDIESKNNEYEMIIKDNGVGLENDFDLNNVSTLGLSLVNVLVDQIDGKIEILKTRGTSFRIIFENNNVNNI